MTHPQRCETCQKDCEITVIDADTKKPISFNPRELRESTLWFVQGINRVGCASHSTAPVPEEQEIDEWCKLHEEILKDIKTEAYRSGYYEGELIRDKSEQYIRQDGKQ